MFEWDPVKDKHYFRGMFQSHLLENKIAAMAGFANKRDIYDDMMKNRGNPKNGRQRFDSLR